MRILYFAAFFKNSIHYYTEEINALIKFNPNIKIVFYTVRCDKNQIIRYNKNVLWVKRRALRNIKIMTLFLKDMLKIFTKFKPNIIHSVYVNESIVMGIFGKIFRVPSILHGRGTDLNYEPFINLERNILARFAGKLNNAILTVSKAMKHDCLKLNIPKNKLFTLYDVIDLDKFNPRKKKEIRKVNSLEILHIGRYSPEKCHELIIETCKELRDNHMNFHLTLIGEGDLEEKINSLIKKYGLEKKITAINTWVNHNEISIYMENADIYIQPSLTEGMPISVLEAMSMRLPVILTKAGGMTELIQKNGGILIDKNNKEQLYNAIVHFIKNPEHIEIGGEINREFIKKNFIWKKHANDLIIIYQKIINKV